MKPLITLMLVAACATIAQAADVTINFDTDAYGNPINAPDYFGSTTRLTTLYSPLGVTFAGPGGNDGGAILNQLGNFGVDARSGVNLLAFNRTTHLSDGGIPRDPETINFDSLVSQVSLYAAGGHTTGDFTMDGYLDSGLVASSTVTSTGGYVLLSVSSPGGMNRVVIRDGSNFAFVFDDLSFNPVPEPSTFALLGVAAIGLLAYAWRRRRQRD